MRILLYVILVVFISGCACSGTPSASLEEACRLMESDPEKALERLNALDVSEFRDSATMARWALLYSEAMARSNLNAPTDTIINIAVDFYGRHHRTPEYRKAEQLKMRIARADRRDALVTARYLQKEKEFMLFKERARQEFYILLCLAILLAAAGIIVWQWQRLRLKSLQNDLLVAEASGLKGKLDANREEAGRLQTALGGLFERRFALVDSLCQTYYESQGTRAERKAIAERVKSEIDSVRTDAAVFAEMEQAVNDCCSGLLVCIKDMCPDIKPEAYQLAVYLACGFSARAVSLLLGESVEVVYKRKSRLKAMLKEKCGTVREDILSIF